MTTATPIDLHALANLPYAGKAAAALAAAGLRLPVEIPEDYELFRIEIDVTLTRSGSASMIIAAEDEDAAVNRAGEVAAQDLVSSLHDGDVEIRLRHARAVNRAEALEAIRTNGLRLEIDE